MKVKLKYTIGNNLVSIYSGMAWHASEYFSNHSVLGYYTAKIKLLK